MHGVRTEKARFSAVPAKKDSVVRCIVYISTKSVCSRFPNREFRSLLVIKKPAKSFFQKGSAPRCPSFIQEGSRAGIRNVAAMRFFLFTICSALAATVPDQSSIQLAAVKLTNYLDFLKSELLLPYSSRCFLFPRSRGEGASQFCGNCIVRSGRQSITTQINLSNVLFQT